MSQEEELQNELKISQLLDAVEARDTKIKHLESQIDTLLSVTDSPKGGEGSPRRKESSVKNLQKRNKTLLYKLNKERGRIAQMENTIKEYKKEFGTLRKKGNQSKNGNNDIIRHYTSSGNVKKAPLSRVSSIGSNISESPKKSDGYKKKYDKLFKMHGVLKFDIEKIKNENVLYKTILRCEIGSDFEEIIKEYRTKNGKEKGKKMWKGRAQQIVLLKTRINFLKSNIKKYKQLSDLKRNSNKPKKENNKLKVESKNVDERSKEKLKQMEQRRRQEQLELTENLQAKTKLVSKLKIQKKAIKSRMSILERNNLDYKIKIDRLLSKTINDGKLISLLKMELRKKQKQVITTKNLLEKTTSLKDSLTITSNMNTSLKSSSLKELMMLEERNNMLTSSVDAKEKIIKGLKKKLELVTKRSLLELKEDANSNESLNDNEKNRLKITLNMLEIEALKKMNKKLRLENVTIDTKLDDVRKKLKLEKLTVKNFMKKDSKKFTEYDKITNESEIFDVNEKLKFVEDENNALKMTVESLREGKKSENKMFQKLLKEEKEKIDNFLKEKLISQIDNDEEEKEEEYSNNINVDSESNDFYEVHESTEIE